MKQQCALISYSIAFFLLLNPSLTNANGLSGHISGFIGLKIMDSSDWPDLDSHFSMGLISDFKKDSWPISIALDIMDTGDKHKHAGMEDLGHTTEFHFGARKFFTNQNPKSQNYIGGGVAFIYAEQEIEVNNLTTKEDDSGIGGWIGAGMHYEISPKFVLGLDVRYSKGNVVLFNKDRDAGGINIGLMAGYQF